MAYKNLKHYRHTVHIYLDAIWRQGVHTNKARTAMYKWLSVQMNLPFEKTHVRMFNREQCRQAIKILRPKYMQLYGRDIYWENKKKGKCIMKIKTELLQEMVAKAIKGAGNNQMLPITSYMGILLQDKILTLMTTDGSNQLRIKNEIELDPMEGPTEQQKFYTIVNADTFSKLVGKTTKEFIELTNRENYLEVSGNGTYKLEIAVNEDGEIVKFPDYNFSATVEGKKISIEDLTNALITSKASVAKTMEVPCLTGVYLADDIISTDRQMVCTISNKLVDEPVLISSELAELIQLLTGETVELYKEDNKLLFTTDKVVIYGKELEGKDIYPVQPIIDLVKLEYNNTIKVNKQDLLNVLDRMSLFVTDYDKNGVFLKFGPQFKITSQKSNAVEDIAYEADSKELTEFECLVDIDMLRAQVESVSTELVELHYGQPKSLKIVDGNCTLVVSLLDKDN